MRDVMSMLDRFHHIALLFGYELVFPIRKRKTAPGAFGFCGKNDGKGLDAALIWRYHRTTDWEWRNEN